MVISIAQYFTDKGEHTILYKINIICILTVKTIILKHNQYIRTGHPPTPTPQFTHTHTHHGPNLDRLQ